jgi:hypothetical protein
MMPFVDPPIYPHIEIFPPVPQAYGSLPSTQHPTPNSERTPASIHGTFSRRIRRTHRELHEEVFGEGFPVNECVEQTIAEPLGGTQARGRTRAKSVSAHPTIGQVQAASLPPTLPPIPPLPTSQRVSLRMPSHNAEARHSVLPAHISETRSRPLDRSTLSRVAPNTHSSPIRHGESISRSNSLTTANSNSRRDHGHPKQGLRPRDSLVLEKARHFDQLHALCKVATFS